MSTSRRHRTNADSPAVDDNAVDCIDDDADVVDDEEDVDGEEPWLGYGRVGGASTTRPQVCGLLLPSSTSRADQIVAQLVHMLALANMVRSESNEDGTR